MTTAKRVGGLWRFDESVLTTAKRVRGCRETESRIYYYKTCRRHVEVWRADFDDSKAFSRHVGVWRVGFGYRYTCRRPVEIRRVCYGYCKG